MEKQRYELERILTVPAGELVCCDYHPEFGTAYIIKQRGNFVLVVNGTKWRDWEEAAEPGIWNIRLNGRDNVLAWNVRGGIGCISPTHWNVIPAGAASIVQVSRNYIFVSYSEDSSWLAEPGQPEANIGSVFSKDGDLILSIDEKLRTLSYSGTFMEVSRACATCEDVFYFLAYQTPHIWTLNVADGKLEPGPRVDVNRVLALSASNEAIHLLQIQGDRCTVRSFDKGSHSPRDTYLDGEASATLLHRAVESRPIFGVQGGAFLAMGDGALDLLSPRFGHEGSQSS